MSYGNLFVAKLPRDLVDNDLLQIFIEFSPLSAKIMLDPFTGSSKGFGFVLFDKEEDGRAAYQHLNRKTVHYSRHNFNLVIYPSQHNGKAVTLSSRAVYIRNIPTTLGKRQVEEFLSSFAPLVYCAMRNDHHGSPVWVVYAEFDTPQSAQQVLDKLHGNSGHFTGPPIMVKFADTHEAKQERRRRREEGRLAPCPALRANCSFPPPRPPTAGPVVARGSFTPGDSPPGCQPSTPLVQDVSIPSPLLDGEPRPQTVYLAQSALTAVPQLLAVDVAYDGAATAPAAVPLATADYSAASGVLLLGNGQRVLLTPGAVNFQQPKFPGPQATVLVPTVDPTLLSIAPQPQVVYGAWQ